MIDSDITLNPVRKTRTQIITTLQEDDEKRIGDDRSPIQTQLRHLTTAGVSYYDQK